MDESHAVRPSVQCLLQGVERQIRAQLILQLAEEGKLRLDDATAK